jgi:hypothetical protein
MSGKGAIMTAKSWAEVETKVAELERELEVYKKALDIESDSPHRDWLLDQARKKLQNGKEL